MQAVHQYDGGIPLYYKFIGKERDAESGNDYFGARYYASSVGPFMTPDWSSTPNAIPFADLNDPQTLNQYGYVRNNPLLFNFSVASGRLTGSSAKNEIPNPASTTSANATWVPASGASSEMYRTGESV